MHDEYELHSIITITNSTFKENWFTFITNNSLLFYRGQKLCRSCAIYQEGCKTIGGGHCCLNGGAGVLYADDGSIVTVHGSHFINNSAVYNGGVVAAQERV